MESMQIGQDHSTTAAALGDATVMEALGGGGDSLRARVGAMSFSDGAAALAFPFGPQAVDPGGPALEEEEEDAAPEAEPTADPGLGEAQCTAAASHPLAARFAEQLGLDPSAVPVHWSSEAARAADADGLATGGAVHLAHDPTSALEDEGVQHTLAHELVHVSQARAGNDGAPSAGAAPHVETEADALADALTKGEDAQTAAHTTPSARHPKKKAAAALSAAQVGRARRYNQGRGFTKRGVRRLCEALGLARRAEWSGELIQAVGRFQRQRGLTVDGMVGPRTWDVVRARLASHHGLAGGSLLTNAEARAAVNYNRGRKLATSFIKATQRKVGVAADGIIGPVTCRGIARFQRSRRLPAYGTLTPKTVAALRAFSPSRPANAPQAGGGAAPGSGNFSLSEFRSKDGSSTPPSVQANLLELIKQLEVLRAALGHVPIHINSGYRSPQHNKNVGGASNSQHVFGRAADLRVNGRTPAQIKAVIESLIKQGKMRQGGVGLYGSWVHYDTRGTAARW